jgi:predicted O-methyltransferase YrrM
VTLPPRVALFYVRACCLAVVRRDWWSLRAATKPLELRALLGLAHGRRMVVESGTGTGWSAAALALADPSRTVVTLDPLPRPGRERYLGLAGAARERIEVVEARSEHHAAAGGEPVDVLYLDGSHGREPNEAAFRAWRPRLAPDAVVAFHDWSNARYPGVREATAALGLDGHAIGDLYVWRAPGLADRIE